MVQLTSDDERSGCDYFSPGFDSDPVRIMPVSMQVMPVNNHAEVVELVDAHVSGACGSNPVRVRVPPSALKAL
jgi:hypothetical protein